MRTASQYGTVNSGVSSRCREPHRGEPTRCSLLRAATAATTKGIANSTTTRPMSGSCQPGKASKARQGKADVHGDRSSPQVE